MKQIFAINVVPVLLNERQTEQQPRLQEYWEQLGMCLHHSFSTQLFHSFFYALVSHEHWLEDNGTALPKLQSREQ